NTGQQTSLHSAENFRGMTTAPDGRWTLAEFDQLFLTDGFGVDYITTGALTGFDWQRAYAWSPDSEWLYFFPAGYSYLHRYQPTRQITERLNLAFLQYFPDPTGTRWLFYDMESQQWVIFNLRDASQQPL